MHLYFQIVLYDVFFISFSKNFFNWLLKVTSNKTMVKGSLRRQVCILRTRMKKRKCLNAPYVNALSSSYIQYSYGMLDTCLCLNIQCALISFSPWSDLLIRSEYSLHCSDLLGHLLDLHEFVLRVLLLKIKI